MRRLAAAVIPLLAIACQTCVAAEPDYPQKPIRILVGFGPGGAADVLARILGQKLTNAWGQSVVIDNRTGATATIAADIAAKAKPDGYTLLVVSSAHAISAGMYKLSYDPVKSFSPIAQIASSPLVLVATPSLPAKSIAELIVAAKAAPGKISFGSSGNGSITFLAGELLKSRTDIDLTHVPYKTMSQLQSDVMGGSIQLAFTSIPAAIGLIRGERLKALAVTSAKRSTSLPEVRTIAESGVAGYEVSNWYGALAPTGLPQPILKKLNTQIVGSMRSAEGVDAITKQGAEPASSTPEQFRAYIAAEVSKWAQLVKASGIQPE